MTAKDVAYLERAFGGVDAQATILDLGCGHGRHASKLGRTRRVTGVDNDPYALMRALPGFEAVNADFFKLPFDASSFGGAYSWYSSLFTFEDSQQVPLFREIARVLQPGALFVFQTLPWTWVSSLPSSQFEGPLEDGSFLKETSLFNPHSGRDEVHRTLRAPDGRELSASFFIRYYPTEGFISMLDESGFSVRWIHGDKEGGPLLPTSTDFILGATRKNV